MDEGYALAGDGAEASPSGDEGDLLWRLAICRDEESGVHRFCSKPVVPRCPSVEGMKSFCPKLPLD